MVVTVVMTAAVAAFTTLFASFLVLLALVLEERGCGDQIKGWPDERRTKKPDMSRGDVGGDKEQR